jgi:hypothetical protein
MRRVDSTNESGYVNPARAAVVVDGQQILEQSLSDFLSIETISEHPIGIRDREDGQAVLQVVIPNHGFQGIWSVVISVSSDEHGFSLWHVLQITASDELQLSDRAGKLVTNSPR